jgi:glyoxylase-like metal-dependent hydrolase (beta-lactamase superfamily II)
VTNRSALSALSPRGGRLTKVANGVHQLTHGGVNCYLLEEEGRLTIVDAALPRTWSVLLRAIEAIGCRKEDVAALVLTHAHFDHVGFARRVRSELGVPVLAHRLEHDLAAHPYRYAHEHARLLYPVLYPKGIPVLAALARNGALWVRGVDDVEDLAPGVPLDVPGHPEVLFVPGHTYGHVALHLPLQDAVLTGDDPRPRPARVRVEGDERVAGAATADSVQNLASLDVLEATGARVVLPGHGDRWHGGIEEAVGLAREAGPS